MNTSALRLWILLRDLLTPICGIVGHQQVEQVTAKHWSCQGQLEELVVAISDVQCLPLKNFRVWRLWLRYILLEII